MSGIDKVFLRQIRTFGDPDRVTGLPGSAGLPDKYSAILKWAGQRFITVVYYGLINIAGTQLVPGGLLKDFKWSDVDHLDNLVMDHAGIVEETRKILTTELLNYPIASSLLPDTFTLKELKGLFEAILDRSIDRGTFRRKILSLGIVEQVDRRKDAPGRPSHLFRFNQEAYRDFLAEETRFGF
jgi:8-oxo-dGTP diphosphatase